MLFHLHMSVWLSNDFHIIKTILLFNRTELIFTLTSNISFTIFNYFFHWRFNHLMPSIVSNTEDFSTSSTSIISSLPYLPNNHTYLIILYLITIYDWKYLLFLYDVHKLCNAPPVIIEHLHHNICNAPPVIIEHLHYNIFKIWLNWI